MSQDVDSTSTINCLEWFYGGGGNHLGLARVIPDLRVVAACEIEAYAVANVVAQIESGQLAPFPIWTNAKTFPLETFRGLIDLFVASYPCQGFSAAGKRQGERDPRFLWPWVFQATVVIRPRRIFFENVEGHITLGLATVISDLEAAGYRCAWGIFSAEECGASHRRKRVFIMADRAIGRKQRLPIRSARQDETAADPMRPGEAVDDSAGARRNGTRQRTGALQEGGQCVPGVGRRQMADARSEQFSGREKQHHVECATITGSGCSMAPGPGELDRWAEILEADPSLEPALCRMADGMAYRVDRLRLCGNGVVPDTAALAYVTLDRELSAKNH